jgi:predicted HicB family RNase H-like nuclease
MSEFNQQPMNPQVEPQGGIATQPQPQSAASIPLPVRCQELQRVATELFRQTPDWVTFFREILGVEGLIHRLFTNPDDMEAFEQSESYAQIQAMVAKLRERSKHQTESNEPTRVITVRLPKSLHESLRAEAHHRRTSMNQLCISKLLQLIDNQLVPSD